METVNMIILLVVTYLVTGGIKSLSQLLGADLSGSAAAITAAIVGLLVAMWQAVIVPVIPASALPLVEPIAGMVIVILGSFGLHKTVKAFQR